MKTPRHKQVVIFDFDGPILDSFEEGIRRLSSILSARGVVFGTRERARVCDEWGRPGRVMLESALGLPPTLAEQIYDVWVELDNREPPPLVLGARAVLAWAHCNMLCTMLTSRHWADLQGALIFHGLRDSFDLIQTADQGFFHKPDPRVFQWTFRALANQIAHDTRVFFVGDTIADIEAGVAAGIETFLVQNGPHDTGFIRAQGTTEAVRQYFTCFPHRALATITELPERMEIT
ncbi:MAG: HAD-IA family hydrolase [bacterium]|nr:HAD-IA family hydrolase [bacterium]